MDFGRTSGRNYAYFDQARTVKGWIRWYPCAPGAKPFPGLHAFLSPRLEDRPEEWDADGEGPGILIRPGESRSNRYSAPPGTHYHGQLEWFESGIPLEVLSGEVPPPPPDPECPPVTLTVRDVTGPSQVNATYDEVGVIDCDRARGQAVEQVEQGRVRLFDLPALAPAPFAVVEVLSTTTLGLLRDSGRLYWVRLFGGSVTLDLTNLAGNLPGWWAWVTVDPDSGGPAVLHTDPLIAILLDGAPGANVTINPGESVLLALVNVGGSFTRLITLARSGPGGSPIRLGTTGVVGGTEGELLRVGSGNVVGETPTVGGFTYT